MSRLSQFRDAVLERILSVNEVTERGVLTAGSCLRSLVEVASSYVARVQSLQVHTNETAHDGLRSVVDRQARSVEHYVADLGGLIQEHNTLAAAALSQIDGITRAEQEIGRLVNASRMLALNAKIEATRLGNAGKPFEVVATEMKSLSQQIDHANAMVGKLVHDMKATLPVVAQHARKMEERSLAFSSDHAVRMKEVEHGIVTLQAAVAEALSTGDEAIRSILSHSQQALSNLQFQDQVAQSLLSVDGKGHALQEELAQELDCTDETLRPPAQPKLGGSEAPTVNEDSGKLLMF